MILTINSITIEPTEPMKKIMILILACHPIGIFAQQSTANDHLNKNKINTTYAALDTSLADDELVFTSSDEISTYNLNEFNSQYFLDLHTGEMKEENSILIKKELFKNANTYLGEGMVSFSKDGKTVFFSVNRRIKDSKRKNEQEVKTKKSVMLRLFKAYVNENGEWINLEMLPFNSNKYSTGQPALNHDDTKLYFVSDGPESLGRTDIFEVDLHKDGTYGTPVNLGPKINSKGREIFPYINKDNLLYFSSDVDNAEGDLDAYGCKIFDNTISTPVKLKRSVNIEKNDFTFNIDDEKNLGLSTSKKQGVQELDNIYTLIDSSPINIECYQEISGVVRNIDTQELLPKVQLILFDSNDKELLSSLSHETDASFGFKQSCNGTYKLKGYLEGYLIEELDIKTVNDLNAESIDIIMNMRKDPKMQIDLIVDEPMSTNTGDLKVVKDKTSEIASPEEVNTVSSYYNFKSNDQVYTVQIGAFQENVQTDKYFNLSSFFNYHYNDGLNRYYSGVFESRLEAVNYLKLIKKKGYNDAFIVGLKGLNRF